LDVKTFCDAEGWQPCVEENNQQVVILPRLFTLNQNCPNPVQNNTIFSYTILQNSKVKLEIFDIIGKPIAILVNDYQKSGHHQIKWDVRNISKGLLPNGVYFYCLIAGDYSDMKKMVILR